MSKQPSKMISAEIMLPTIAPMAVLSSLGEPVGDVGPAVVELEVDEDRVDEPVGNDPVEVTDKEEVKDEDEVADDEEVWDDGVDDVGGKVEEGGVVKVDGRVGVTSVEPGCVGDTGGELSVLGGGVGPP
jgi:hypothetical protein